MFVFGVGIGATMQVLVIATQNAIDYADLGAGTSGVTFFRSIGGSFGTAVFGAIFDYVLPGNVASALHGRALPRGISVAGGASPAALAKLPPPVHAAVVSGYAASIRTVFLAAIPVGAVAFVLTWMLRELPLRSTSRAVDPADRLAPTARPTIRTSDEEMRRAVSTLLVRERRREVYSHLVAASGIVVTPRAGWLLLRLGEHLGESSPSQDGRPMPASSRRARTGSRCCSTAGSRSSIRGCSTCSARLPTSSPPVMSGQDPTSSRPADVRPLTVRYRISRATLRSCDQRSRRWACSSPRRPGRSAVPSTTPSPGLAARCRPGSCCSR